MVKISEKGIIAKVCGVQVYPASRLPKKMKDKNLYIGITLLFAAAFGVVWLSNQNLIPLYKFEEKADIEMPEIRDDLLNDVNYIESYMLKSGFSKDAPNEIIKVFPKEKAKILASRFLKGKANWGEPILILYQEKYNRYWLRYYTPQHEYNLAPRHIWVKVSDELVEFGERG